MEGRWKLWLWSRVPVRLKTNGDRRVQTTRSPLRAWKSLGPTISIAPCPIAAPPTNGQGNDVQLTKEDGEDATVVFDSWKSKSLSIKQLGAAINKCNYTIYCFTIITKTPSNSWIDTSITLKCNIPNGLWLASCRVFSPVFHSHSTNLSHSTFFPLQYVFDNIPISYKFWKMHCFNYTKESL